jgi:hypothetical protein
VLSVGALHYLFTPGWATARDVYDANAHRRHFEQVWA